MQFYNKSQVNILNDMDRVMETNKTENHKVSIGRELRAAREAWQEMAIKRVGTDQRKQFEIIEKAKRRNGLK
jgi:hypothetical protein